MKREGLCEVADIKDHSLGFLSIADTKHEPLLVAFGGGIHIQIEVIVTGRDIFSSL